MAGDALDHVDGEHACWLKQHAHADVVGFSSLVVMCLQACLGPG